MNAKTTIRKILFVTMWLCIGGLMFTLLLAAISKKNKGLCRDYSITIKGVRTNFFIDEKDVKDLVMKSVKGNIKGQPIASFNLHELEQLLEHSTWIDEAELYFDNQDMLHISIIEKEPVARIFTVNNNSFYIDSTGHKMPLSDKLSARVPVFTGFPDKKVLSKKDSVLLNDVRLTANYITQHPFWMSEVAQIDITADNNFEMTPVVGNHLVKLGNGDDIAQKFSRLMVFYKQVLSKTGFEKYKVIDVQYKGQVVASRYAGDVKVDSIQLRRNVEKLLQQAKEAQDDTTIRALPVAGRYDIDVDSASAPVSDLPVVQPATNPDKHSNPNPVKVLLPKKDDNKADKPKQPVKTDKPKIPVKTDKAKQPEKKDPKAVMPKRQVVESEYGGYN